MESSSQEVHENLNAIIDYQTHHRLRETAVSNLVQKTSLDTTTRASHSIYRILHIAGSQKRRGPERASNDLVCIRDYRHPLCRLRTSVCAQVVLFGKETLAALRLPVTGGSANKSLLNLIFSQPATAAPSPKCDKKNSQTNPKAAIENQRLLVCSACAWVASERRIKMQVGDALKAIECSSFTPYYVFVIDSVSSI